MTSRRRRSEVDAEFRETIGEMLRCVSADSLAAFPGWETQAGHSRLVRFISERSRLRQAGGGRLFLSIEYVYIVTDTPLGGLRVQTLSYVYTMFDAREQRVLGWHYHPGGRAGESIPIPHLHIYVENEVGSRTLSKLHVPTGHVGPDVIIAFLIEEMGDEPREEYRRVERGEARWRRILREGADALSRLQD